MFTVRLSILRELPVVASLVLVLLGSEERSHAYPQWQFTTGTVRCNQCHFSPAGGGLINNYGRDANGDELSTWQGDGSFLHGAAELPRYLKLGADVRFAFLRHDNGGPDAPTLAIFPMQADVHARTTYRDFALQATIGGRAQVRTAEGALPPGSARPEHPTRILSREHWLIWQPEARGPYARAGRFFAPFGLRLAEHIVTIRRDVGFNLLQETYNLSGGFIDDRWEAHATILGPDVLQGGTREKGFAAVGEYRPLDHAAAGAQVKWTSDFGVTRLVAGAFGKFHVESAHVMLLGEANLIRHMPLGTTGVNQFSGLLGGSWLTPVRGLLVTIFVERLENALGLLDAGMGAVTALVSWFPYPHFEAQLVGRGQMTDGDRIWPTMLFMLHYFL